MQYRQGNHKDIQEHNIQILTQNKLTLKFEITVKLNNLVVHPLPLAPPNKTAQSVPSQASQQKLSINTIVIQKRHMDTSQSIIHIQDYPTHVFFNILLFQTLLNFTFSGSKNHNNPFPQTDPKIY